jgi:YHS domain-containing protein
MQKTATARAIDPVCGMQVYEDSDFFSYYKDRVYYFCSAQDKTEFDRHPEEYVTPKKEIRAG